MSQFEKLSAGLRYFIGEMKPALIAAVSFTLIVGFAPWGKAEQRPANVTTSAQDQNPPVIAPSVSDKQSPADNGGRNQQSLQGDTPAQWILVIVTSITAAFIGWQSWETRRAAEASRDNALAARAGAEAMITESRPWLLIQRDMVGDKIQSPHLVPVEDDPSSAARMSHCIFSIMNYGKTPAKVLTEKTELQISESLVTPPDPDVYKVDFSRANPYMFPQGVSMPAQAVLAPFGFIKLSDRDAIRNKSKFLWLCGFIRYSDTFERKKVVEYETRFCYLMETRMNADPFWKPAGPGEYNRAT